MCYLLELGLRAARAARWLGLAQAPVREGPFWVHQWPERIWDEAARPAAPCPAGPPPLQAAQAVNRSPGYAAPPPTRVANLARGEPFDVYIGRPGPWGNPFVLGRDGDRATVIARHAAWITGQPALMARLGELRGRVLGCHCKPEPCHGDILAALADRAGALADRMQPYRYRYTHSGDPAWESADGDPEGYGDPPAPREPQRRPQPVPGPSEGPRLTAWQYAGKARLLTGEGDVAFVAELDSAAAYVASRRGLGWQPHWSGGVVFSAWPESLWRDVSGAMAQIGAERGETELGEDELDAVADGYLPDPGYRPGGKPSAAQFMRPGWGEPDDFWSYPPPPEDTQAYLDWTQMADEASRGPSRWYGEYGPWVKARFEGDCDGCGTAVWPGDSIRADGRGGWLCAVCGDEDASEPPGWGNPHYETRDAGWGEGVAPWDGDDIRPY
jgi:uncharacterized protein DUF4326